MKNPDAPLPWPLLLLFAALLCVVLTTVAVWQWMRRVLLFLGNRRIDKASGTPGNAEGAPYCSRGTGQPENIKPVGVSEIPLASNRPARRDPNRVGCPYYNFL